MVRATCVARPLLAKRKLRPKLLVVVCTNWSHSDERLLAFRFDLPRLVFSGSLEMRVQCRVGWMGLHGSGKPDRFGNRCDIPYIDPSAFGREPPSMGFEVG